MANYRVCKCHFEEDFITDYIESNGSSNICNYCEDEAICVKISDLAEMLEEGIYTEYCEPYAEGAIYDKEEVFYEDRFPFLSVSTTADILQEEFNIDDWDLACDISQYFEHQYLASQALYSLEEHESLLIGWDEFKEIIKHKMRFLFFRGENETQFENSQGESTNPYYILDEVGSAVNRLSLITHFPVGHLQVFRGRQHEIGCEVDTAEQLGSPPEKIAKNNRMSPAGISMFYGAFESETCFQEIVDESWDNSEISIGMFTNTKKLNLIDFTKFNGVPSLLDKKNRINRPASKFIQSFLKDVAKPITPDDKIHLEYIPTQVVSEYFRFGYSKQKPIHGIIYNSVKNPDGKCVVLFANNKQIVDDNPGMGYSETILSLSQKSIQKRPIVEPEPEPESFFDWLLSGLQRILPKV